jgi:hypothetical protein
MTNEGYKQHFWPIYLHKIHAWDLAPTENLFYSITIHFVYVEKILKFHTTQNNTPQSSAHSLLD